MSGRFAFDKFYDVLILLTRQPRFNQVTMWTLKYYCVNWVWNFCDYYKWRRATDSNSQHCNSLCAGSGKLLFSRANFIMNAFQLNSITSATALSSSLLNLYVSLIGYVFSKPHFRHLIAPEESFFDAISLVSGVIAMEHLRQKFLLIDGSLWRKIRVVRNVFLLRIELSVS